MQFAVKHTDGSAVAPPYGPDLEAIIKSFLDSRGDQLWEMTKASIIKQLGPELEDFLDSNFPVQLFKAGLANGYSNAVMDSFRIHQKTLAEQRTKEASQDPELTEAIGDVLNHVLRQPLNPK